MFDLPPVIYNALQKIVHGDYSKERQIIQGFRRGKPGVTLEIGCGTGLVSEMFTTGTYAGADVDEKRVEMAREMHPGHDFFVLDFTKDYSEILERYDAILFNNCIHHIDDQGVAQMLDNIKAAVSSRGRPIEIIAIEPVLPRPAIRNLPGYLLAKLDRGRYVRTYEATVSLFDGNILAANELKGPWFWPVPGVALNVSIA